MIGFSQSEKPKTWRNSFSLVQEHEGTEIQILNRHLVNCMADHVARTYNMCFLQICRRISTRMLCTWFCLWSLLWMFTWYDSYYTCLHALTCWSFPSTFHPGSFIIECVFFFMICSLQMGKVFIVNLKFLFLWSFLDLYRNMDCNLLRNEMKSAFLSFSFWILTGNFCQFHFIYER